MCSATVAKPQQIPAQPTTPTHDRGTRSAQAAPPKKVAGVKDFVNDLEIKPEKAVAKTDKAPRARK